MFSNVEFIFVILIDMHICPLHFFSLETLLVKQMQKHLLKSEEHFINNKLIYNIHPLIATHKYQGSLKIDPTD